MRRDTRTILIGGSVAVLVASIVVFTVYRHHVRASALVAMETQERWYADGRDVRIMIAGNANDRTAVVLVLHNSTPDTQRRVLKPGRVDSTNDPIQGLLSAARVTAHYPPDSEVSGFWLDGQKIPTSDQMLVTYISDKTAATNIAVLEAEQTPFVRDARSLDPLLFIERWITPRLPGAG